MRPPTLRPCGVAAESVAGLLLAVSTATGRPPACWLVLTGLRKVIVWQPWVRAAPPTMEEEEEEEEEEEVGTVGWKPLCCCCCC